MTSRGEGGREGGLGGGGDGGREGSAAGAGAGLMRSDAKQHLGSSSAVHSHGGSAGSAEQLAVSRFEGNVKVSSICYLKPLARHGKRTLL